MTNVRAGKLFGTANGALINYVEATVLSLLLMLVLKNWERTGMGPYRLRPVVGVSREYLRTAGTAFADCRDAALEHVLFCLFRVLESTKAFHTLLIIFSQNLSLLRAAGIFLLLVGMVWVEKEKKPEGQDSSAEGE